MIERKDALKLWLEWDDRTEEGKERFFRATGWMPLLLGGFGWELTFVLQNPA